MATLNLGSGLDVEYLGLGKPAIFLLFSVSVSVSNSVVLFFVCCCSFTLDSVSSNLIG